MSKMMVVVVIALLAGCGADSMIPRDEACSEQADIWCDAIGFHSSAGCTAVYMQRCGDAGEVRADAQAACLDALAAMQGSAHPLGYVEPNACVATWR